jgi:redox-sensitive bicupin YhaK (pirin superfamily)
MGNGSTMRPGDVQRMSAGTGVLHSEYNHAPNDVTHFLQIWIEPDTRGIAPSYEQKAFPDEEKRGRLRLVASPDGRDGSVRLHADAALYAGLFNGDEGALYDIAPGRGVYLHLVRGTLMANGVPMEAGDALKLVDEVQLIISHGREAEVLLFDLA